MPPYLSKTKKTKGLNSQAQLYSQEILLTTGYKMSPLYGENDSRVGDTAGFRLEIMRHESVQKKLFPLYLEYLAHKLQSNRVQFQVWVQTA